MMLRRIGKREPDVLELNFGLHYVGEAVKGDLQASYALILDSLFHDLRKYFTGNVIWRRPVCHLVNGTVGLPP